jgi:hypothetical protein
VSKRAQDFERAEIDYIRSSAEERERRDRNSEEQRRAERARQQKIVEEQEKMKLEKASVQRSRKMGFLAAGGIAAAVIALAFVIVYAIASKRNKETKETGRIIDSTAVSRAEVVQNCETLFRILAKRIFKTAPPQCDSGEKTNLQLEKLGVRFKTSEDCNDNYCVRAGPSYLHWRVRQIEAPCLHHFSTCSAVFLR